MAKVTAIRQPELPSRVHSEAKKQKLMRISSMRRAGQKECLTYSAGCMKVINGEKKICPLKGDLRMCYGINTSVEEIEAAYRKMFPEKQHG